MPGDKRPEHTPDIGGSGRFFLLLLVGFVVLVGVGGLFFD